MFNSLRAKDLQDNLDACNLKYANLELIRNPYRQMYKYADNQRWCDKDYSQYAEIKRDDDDEHGVPFSDTDLKTLWDNKTDEIAEMFLIACHSGRRISECISLEVSMEKKYFMGGIKTKAGKGRTVPIHSGIPSLVEHRASKYGKFLPCSDKDLRNQMDELLNRPGIPSDPKYTSHDCRYSNPENTRALF